jgi:small ligand-binding sensory domain FIST
MKAGGALVLTADADDAASRAVAGAWASLGTASPEFAVLFASAHFLGSATALLAAVTRELGPVPLIGCVAEGVVGGGREVESDPAVSLWLAAGLGPVETFAMDFVGTPSGGAFGGYLFGPSPQGVHLMLCDPFTFPAGDLLDHLNSSAPGATVMGGIASGGLALRQSRLFLDDRVVGQPFTITEANESLITGLGGRAPLERLKELAASLHGRDRELLGQGVHLGLVINSSEAEPGQGDFLIRGLVGADPDSGAIAVSGEVEVGQAVQFHVRDADSADEDLRRTLKRETAALGARPPAGALLFTCNGRGSRMFPGPDHDAGLLAETLGEIPVAGFFCAGEIGPVAGRNFLHTFTASAALFPQ